MFISVSVSFPEDLVDILDDIFADRDEYRSRSHLIEIAVRDYLTAHHMDYLLKEERDNDQE